MGIPEMLDELKQKALHDDTLRQELLVTRKDEQPLTAFCRKCQEYGYPIYEMEIVLAGRGILCNHETQYKMVVEKILRCWKVKMIFMNCFLPDCRC